jgi:hypothetical protein
MESKPILVSVVEVARILSIGAQSPGSWSESRRSRASKLDARGECQSRPSKSTLSG